MDRLKRNYYYPLVNSGKWAVGKFLKYEMGSGLYVQLVKWKMGIVDCEHFGQWTISNVRNRQSWLLFRMMISLTMTTDNSLLHKLTVTFVSFSFRISSFNVPVTCLPGDTFSYISFHLTKSLYAVISRFFDFRLQQRV